MVGGVVAHAETASPLEPYVWQLGVTKIEANNNNRLRIGHAAVAGLLTFPLHARFVAVGAKHFLAFGDSAPPLISEEAIIVQAAITSLHGSVDLRTYRTTIAQHNTTQHNTGPIVARLLSNPAKFTLSELRIVFEAIFDRALDPSTFGKSVRTTLASIVDTGHRGLANERGRPAAVYRISAEQHAIPDVRHQPAGSS